MAAVAASSGLRLLVLATESTVKRHAYARAIHAIAPGAHVEELACSMFVALAEEGWTDGPIAEAVARQYLNEPMSRSPAEAPDTVVLGCTHYPLLRDAIRAAVGPAPAIIDSATTTAARVAQILEDADLKTERAGRGALTLLATDGPDRFAAVGSMFLGEQIQPSDVEVVDL